jgi:hypothetical protein
MAAQITINCDVCGKQKGEVNHWFVIDVDSEGCHIQEFGVTDLNPENRNRTMKDVCGAECAIKVVQRFLGNGTLEEE